MFYAAVGNVSFFFCSTNSIIISAFSSRSQMGAIELNPHAPSSLPAITISLIERQHVQLLQAVAVRCFGEERVEEATQLNNMRK